MREGAFVWIQKSCVFGATLCFFIKTFQLHTSKSDLCVGMNLSIYLAISILDIKQLPSCLRPMYPLYTFSNNHDISGMWGPSHDWRFPLKVLVIWNRDIPPTLWEESGLRVYDVRPLVTFATHWPKKGCEQKQIPVGDFLQLPPWTWITCFGKGIYIYIYYTSFQRNGYFWYRFNRLVNFSGVRNPPLKEFPGHRPFSIINPWPSRMMVQQPPAALQVLWRHSRVPEVDGSMVNGIKGL